VSDRPEVHVRMLVSDDAPWVVETDRISATPLARSHGWDVEGLRTALEEGAWASGSSFGWAVIADGQPGGFALVTGLDTGDARMSVRLAPTVRGQGVAREVLRKLADHHFSADPHLNRLTGRAHEHNVPMQRVFNAAGFRMEARYRDSFKQADDGYAAEWGYALTRADWEAGRHHTDQAGYDLHGLTFEMDEAIEGAAAPGTLVRFLQEGRRVLARYDGPRMVDGELAGLLLGDLLQYRFVHVADDLSVPRESTGRGRARLQRRKDGRLEIVDEWSTDAGTHGRRVMVQRVGVS
jgi:RimJ/RimL family protein N-acetyltransferase